MDDQHDHTRLEKRPEPNPALLGFKTEELVAELLSRNEANMIGIVAIDESCGKDQMKVLYETSGEPSLLLCLARDFRYISLGLALESGMDEQEIQDIVSMVGDDSEEPGLGGEPDGGDDEGEEWKRRRS